jgi:hypothetical protein
MNTLHRMKIQQSQLQLHKGRAIAQAVSCWLSTAAARVRARSGHVGFVVDEVALRQVFSEYFGFPCQALHQILHHHNHPGLVQQASWCSTCRVDSVEPYLTSSSRPRVCGWGTLPPDKIATGATWGEGQPEDLRT